jgi:hypothetical protein
MASPHTNICWVSGYRASIPAKTAYKEINKIKRKNNGEVRPESVVAAARLKKSLLHNAFEWDNTVAGKEYRLEQARRMLRSLHVVRVQGPQKPSRYLEVTRTAGPNNGPVRNAYRTLEDVMSDPRSRAELLGRALRELVSFRDRFRGLQELAIVFRAADEVLEKVDL